MTYTDVTVVGAADEHLLTAFADIHAIDDLFVSRVPPYPIASFNIPTGQMHVCRRGEEDLGVA